MAATSRKAARTAFTGGRAAPFGRRIVAFLINWYVGSLVTAVPVAAVAVSLGYQATDQNVLDYPAPWGLIAAVTGIVAGVVYYGVVPMLTKGQTLGKRLLGLRIVGRDGERATACQLVLRQVLGLILLEQAAVGTSTVVQQVIALLAGATAATVVMWVGYALTLASFAVCGAAPSHRALHDLISGTRVVPA